MVTNLLEELAKEREAKEKAEAVHEAFQVLSSFALNIGSLPTQEQRGSVLRLGIGGSLLTTLAGLIMS